MYNINMDNEIIEKIKAGESDVVEFKKSTSELKNAIEDICAFANHKDGMLIFGVDPEGNVIGQDISNSTIEKVTTQILNLISPKIYPLITKVEIEGKQCLVVELESNFEKPYFYKGKAYKRVGTSNSFLSPYEIKKYIYERDNEKYRWERGKLEKDWNLISEEKIRKFLHRVNINRNLNFDENETIPVIFEKLDLLNNGEITTSQYSINFGISLRTAREDIRGLVKFNIVEEVGKTNKRYYRLKWK